MPKKQRSLEDLIVNILNWKKDIKISKSDLEKPKTLDEKIENGFKNFIKSPRINGRYKNLSS